MERLVVCAGGFLTVFRNRVLQVIFLASAVFVLSGDVLADNITRIMPLGDSITRGWYGSVYDWGYRKPLYDLLTNSGYSFDFVGCKAIGDFPDPNHEGRDGWQANELLNGRPSAPAEGKLADWLTADQPDVILLHIGTNDVTWGDINPNDVNGILDVIDAFEISSGRHVTVILALIINRRVDSPAYMRSQTTQFNSDVHNIALNRIANGDDIIIVDMESALNYDIGVDMDDDVHPNDNGYAKMANVWYGALVDYFSSLTVAISGRVLGPDSNTPVGGLLIQTDNNDVNAVTDNNGFYALSVNCNWSGAVTPQKDGYVFEPNSYVFNDVNQDYTDANYLAIPETFKISGFVFEQDYVTPMSGVSVSAENGGGSWASKNGGGASITDSNGYYEVVVDFNWSGNVTVDKYACVFEPGSRYYADVNRNYVAGQNYTGNQLDFRISGLVRNGCNTPIEGVLVSANNGGSQDSTDSDGFYEVWVDSGWSGMVTLSKQHYTFDPNGTSYVGIVADQTNQNYAADNVYDLDCDGNVGWGDVDVLAHNWLGTGQGDFNGSGKIDFVDFAELAGIL